MNPKRVMPLEGAPANMEVPALERAELLTLFERMIFTRVLDEKMLNLQRQGRIGFYGPTSGQEAAGIGSAFALEERDWVFPALREGSVLLMRGFPLDLYIAQMIGNSLDGAKGRQMPCHFSSREHRFVSLSSVIATQLPQAVGAAMAARYEGSDAAVIAYLGDGATSSHEFHAAMTFAAASRAPCVMFCQNNQWAISVPLSGQTASDGLAVKAGGYGMEAETVDGNDVLAVYAVTRQAMDRARAAEPFFVEAVTYRRGGHSSSDDPSRYRTGDEVESWLLEDPIDRYRDWLKIHAEMTEQEELEMQKKAAQSIEDALRKVEHAAPPDTGTLFDDVCADLTPELERQRDVCLGADGGKGLVGGEFPL